MTSVAAHTHAWTARLKVRLRPRARPTRETREPRARLKSDKKPWCRDAPRAPPRDPRCAPLPDPPSAPVPTLFTSQATSAFRGRALGAARLARPARVSVAPRANGSEPSEYGDGRSSSYDEVFDIEENSRKRHAPPSGNFRAKTGGIGDVLERGGAEGADYSDVVEAVNNDLPVEGTVVESGSANNVVDGGLNLEASILAGAVDASFVDGNAPQNGSTSMGDASMDALSNEIANKNNIDDEAAFRVEVDGEGEGAANASADDAAEKPPREELSYAEGGSAEPREEYDAAELPEVEVIADVARGGARRRGGRRGREARGPDGGADDGAGQFAVRR